MYRIACGIVEKRKFEQTMLSNQRRETEGLILCIQTSTIRFKEGPGGIVIKGVLYEQ